VSKKQTKRSPAKRKAKPPPTREEELARLIATQKTGEDVVDWDERRARARGDRRRQGLLEQHGAVVRSATHASAEDLVDAMRAVPGDELRNLAERHLLRRFGFVPTDEQLRPLRHRPDVAAAEHEAAGLLGELRALAVRVSEYVAREQPKGGLAGRGVARAALLNLEPELRVWGATAAPAAGDGARLDARGRLIWMLDTYDLFGIPPRLDRSGAHAFTREDIAAVAVLLGMRPVGDGQRAAEAFQAEVEVIKKRLAQSRPVIKFADVPVLLPDKSPHPDGWTRRIPLGNAPPLRGPEKRKPTYPRRGKPKG